jgi:hypothetical protein
MDDRLDSIFDSQSPTDSSIDWSIRLLFCSTSVWQSFQHSARYGISRRQTGLSNTFIFDSPADWVFVVRRETRLRLFVFMRQFRVRFPYRVAISCWELFLMEPGGCKSCVHLHVMLFDVVSVDQDAESDFVTPVTESRRCLFPKVAVSFIYSSNNLWRALRCKSAWRLEGVLRFACVVSFERQPSNLFYFSHHLYSVGVSREDVC